MRQCVGHELADYELEQVVIFRKAPAGKCLTNLLTRVADLDRLWNQAKGDGEFMCGSHWQHCPPESALEPRPAEFILSGTSTLDPLIAAGRLIEGKNCPFL
jgi:hypothetical protein